MPRLHKHIRGSTLLDILVGANLLAVTTLSVSVGFHVVGQQVRKSEDRATIVARVQTEIENRKALADLGTLLAGSGVTTFNIRNATVTVTTVTTEVFTPERPDLHEIVATATWNDGEAQTLSMRTMVRERNLGNVISVNFTPAAPPYMNTAPHHYMAYGVGFYQQTRWNSIASANGSEVLVDSKGQTTTMVVSGSPSVATLNNGVLLPTPVAVTSWSANTRAIYEGGLEDTANLGSVSLKIQSVPYPRYNVVVYFGMMTDDPISGTFLSIDNERLLPIDRLDTSDRWVNYYHYLWHHRNFLVLGPFEKPNVELGFINSTRAPSISAVQVAELP